MTEPVIILGMHRSGTSCLSGCLAEHGLALDAAQSESRYDHGALFENAAFRRINEAVMTYNGVNWRSPRADLSWPACQRERRDTLIATFDGIPHWGFKDPRTLFTLEGWLEAAPGARLVGALRHPLAVARSLHARNKFELAKGLELWRRYNERLLALHDRFDFPIMNYDWPQPLYEERFRRLTRRLGLPAGGKLTVLDPGLRHHQAGSDAIDPALDKLHAELSHRANQSLGYSGAPA